MASPTFSLDDTIAAIATPLGPGAIGIVRISGPQAYEIAERLFVPSHKNALSRNASHRLIHGWIIDTKTETQVDQVLAAVMRGPHSYTGQDVVEFQAHGSAVALQEILELTLVTGARMAQPGEFTLRAFINGRLDLAQAEAVMDVIEARTSASLRVATRQLGGDLSRQVAALRKSLVDLLAYLEARIDFVDDEIPKQDVAKELVAARTGLDSLLVEADRGMLLRQGIRTAIVGRPNVGKSSLLNRLLRRDRAIVTPVPGTTRDTLQETINIEGVPFVLVDTAGINTSADPVERIGVERSRQALTEADLVLVVVDGSLPPNELDKDVAELIGDQPSLVIVNKCDLPQVGETGIFIPHAARVEVSALTGEGIDNLEQAMLALVAGGQVTTNQEPVISSPRHISLLQRADGHIADALRSLAQGETEDLLAIDVREAIVAMGEITGEDAGEDLLASIFSRFCVGK